jgi:fructose transport system ATP-binding protein
MAAPRITIRFENMSTQPILQARGLTKKYGTVVALNNADFDLYPGEILGVIGDNGAGKSTLIKALCGAVTPDHGEIKSSGPLGSIFRLMDRSAMRKFAREKLSELGLMTIQNIDQPVETLSGGQRQGVAVARAAAFGSKVVIMDEPTAALGVKESRRVLELIRDVKKRGLPIILISHNMPHVFEVCDRIHIHRLGSRLCTIRSKDFSMSDAVAMMTGAKAPPPELLG